MNSGTINVNMVDMKKFNVCSDNVRVFESIKKNKGSFFTLDTRPYVEELNEFGIFYTITQRLNEAWRRDPDQ